MSTTPIVIDDDGRETHPSFGKVTVSRVHSNPGAFLFDSSTQHSEYVVVTLHEADRIRDLHHDWIHPGKDVVEIAMSLAQWGDFVSSFGQGSGTSVTITRKGYETIPGADHESRLAVTAKEVAGAAKESTEAIVKASQAVSEAFARKAGRAEMSRLLNDLKHVTENVPSNMKFAGDTLTKHAEEVVSRAKADIEAMHIRAAQSASNQITDDPYYFARVLEA